MANNGKHIQYNSCVQAGVYNERERKDRRSVTQPRISLKSQLVPTLVMGHLDTYVKGEKLP